MEFEKASEDMVKMFGELAPSQPDVERKKMFGYPTCFINGNMFIGLHGNKFIIRLNAADRESLLKQKGTEVFAPMPGRPMREYVVVPRAMLAERSIIAGWINKSADYARSLPPKEKKPRKTKK